MRKILLAIYMVLAVVPVQACYRSQKAEKGKQSQNPSQNGALVVIQQEQDDEKDGVRGNQPPYEVRIVSTPSKDVWDKASVFINGMLVVIGAVGVFTAFITLRRLEMQIRAAKDADRAWIVARVASSPEEPMTGNLLKGIPPEVGWELVIAGNTPARILRVDIRCRIVDSSPGDVFHIGGPAGYNYNK